jgi:hypothetical protein
MSTPNQSANSTAAFCLIVETNASFCLIREQESQKRPSVQLQLKDLTKTVQI